MMAHHVTPLVVNNILRLPGITRIQVGSRRWFNWLQTATTFSYQLSGWTYRLTLRREKRRRHFYWYAYLKKDRKLHNVYAGRSEALTADHLSAVYQRMMGRIQHDHS
jgi:LuxR family transcriptional regulator, maltose regulon positive regulatory protein